MIYKLGGGMLNDAKVPGSTTSNPSTTTSTKPNSGAGKSSLLNIPKDQHDAVQTMQQAMIDLEMQIIGSKQSIFDNLKDKGEFKTADELAKFAQSFGHTAMGFAGASAADGIWGTNTKIALGKIIIFVTRLKLTGIVLKDGPTYKEAKNEEIIKNADDNTSNIYKIFGELGIKSSMQQKSIGNETFDIVGRDLGKEEAVDPLGKPYTNGIPVTSNALASVLKFFDFVSINGMRVSGTACEALGSIIPKNKEPIPTAKKKDIFDERDPWTDKAKADDGNLMTASAYAMASWDYSKMSKIAQEIKANLIVKIAQDKPVEVSPKTNKEVSNNPLCVNEFEQLIYWFARRAHSLYAALYNLQQSNKQNPKTNKPVTDAELNLALSYQKLVDGLWAEWSKIKKHVEKAIRDTGNAEKPVIDRNVLIDYAYGAGSNASGLGQGAARQRSGYSVPGAGGIGNEGGVGTEAGPVSTFIDADSLISRGFALSDKGKAALENLQAHMFNLKDWTGQSGVNWQTLAITYSGQEDEVGKIEDFQNIGRNISTVISDFYNQWVNNSDPPTEVKQINFQLVQRWFSAIRSMLSSASRQTSITGGGGRGQIGNYPVQNRPTKRN